MLSFSSYPGHGGFYQQAPNSRRKSGFHPKFNNGRPDFIGGPYRP
jgi:hypothetical protein